MNRGYFVFSYSKQGKINGLLGSTAELPEFENLTYKDEPVNLPKVFMLGKTFAGHVVYTEAGTKVVAFVAIGDRPLAL